MYMYMYTCRGHSIVLNCEKILYNQDYFRTCLGWGCGGAGVGMHYSKYMYMYLESSRGTNTISRMGNQSFLGVGGGPGKHSITSICMVKIIRARKQANIEDRYTRIVLSATTKLHLV